MSKTKLYGPFFFIEQGVTGYVYLDMLWLFPQLSDSSTFFFQQEEAPPHWSTIVRDFLNRELPHHWIGRTDLDDVRLLPWPPRTPDFMPCDFFLWGYVKDKVYVAPKPTTLQERITAAVIQTQTCY
ncbi:hypothetical protein AVEN_243683-1 [Araneus ventricosus]|uniref:Tc1-like transposase DDE domain-containing protein n=1 Tax=Araneus ventricosus TaxID=182803 RepID=A0A4Y2A7D8_ARAVE|nr:hypothetical protein AVEN_243683-1 [Araneus ventricosus]